MTYDLQKRREELEKRNWSLPDIEARFNELVNNGMPKKAHDPEKTLSQKENILDRVQLRAEEYCYLTRNCAQGSATALLEEFGMGSMENIRALAPFPGIAMTGGICGPVAGGLVALGLYFTGPDPAGKHDAMHYAAARKYTQRFEGVMGSLYCPDIQQLLLGKYFDPMGGSENLEAFNAANAREKCPLAPGMGARIAAEVIVDSMAR